MRAGVSSTRHRDAPTFDDDSVETRSDGAR